MTYFTIVGQLLQPSGFARVTFVWKQRVRVEMKEEEKTVIACANSFFIQPALQKNERNW